MRLILFEVHDALVFPPFLVRMPSTSQRILQRFLFILFRPFKTLILTLTLALLMTLNTIDVAKCAPVKVIQGSPCLEVRTLTSENGRSIMKLNDIYNTKITVK